MFITLALLLTLPAFAQTILRGTITNLPANSTRQILVECWNVERWKILETVDLRSDGAFSTTLQNPKPGQYRLRLQKQSQLWNDFIVSDSTAADTLLDFKLDYAAMIGGPVKVANSEANALYYNF